MEIRQRCIGVALKLTFDCHGNQNHSHPFTSRHLPYSNELSCRTMSSLIKTIAAPWNHNILSPNGSTILFFLENPQTLEVFQLVQFVSTGTQPKLKQKACPPPIKHPSTDRLPPSIYQVNCRLVTFPNRWLSPYHRNCSWSRLDWHLFNSTRSNVCDAAVLLSLPPSSICNF